MKYFKILFFLFFYISLINISYAEIVYPIQTMSKLECRFKDYDTLGDDCKMPLPILNTSDYIKYKNDYNLYRRVYTVLWGSSYNYGWDIGNGGHQGVDIVSSKGTPVYSITDGKVILAKNLIGRGNTVKIEHIINGVKIYSNYSHLSKIDVSVGDKVYARTKIGEIGSTGNSFGNHLHFQIDLSISNPGPWYRSNCSEKNYENIINTNICFDQLNKNTIDPLLFLETGGAIIKMDIIDKPKQEVISQIGLLSRKEILKKEIEEFLNIYDVKVNIMSLGGNIELGKSGTFRISVIDKKTKKPFTGSFPGDMNFKFEEKKFSVFPMGIFQIENGIRDFQITPKMSGKMTIDVYIGETFFKKITFGVIDTKKSIIPTSSVLFTNKKNIISNNSKGMLYFKDNFGLNILGFQFNGKFKLKSNNNSVKFCIKKGNNISDINYLYNSNCDEKHFLNEVEFSYKDTISGILIFDYKVNNIGLNTLNIEYNSKPFSSRNLLGIEPYDIDVNHPYYADIMNFLKLGFISGLSKGYILQNNDLSTFDGINMLTSVLDHKILKCNTKECKNTYLEKLHNLSKYKADKYTYFTRGEYLKLIGDTLNLQIYTGGDYISFRDLNSDLQEYSKNILKGKTWNDYFGKTRYFQPDKKITRGEGVFLLNNILD